MIVGFDILILTNMKQEKILHYYAIFEPAKEGGYNVSFPSFPGCVTFGRTFEEAKVKAKEVLELWLEELQEQNQAIPLYTDHPIVYEILIKSPLKRSPVKEYAPSNPFLFHNFSLLNLIHSSAEKFVNLL